MDDTLDLESATQSAPATEIEPAEIDNATTADLPMGIELVLTIKDRDTIAELCRHLEGDDRDEFAVQALKIGVLALKQARGQLDGDVIRRESDRMLDMLHGRLNQHAEQLNDRLTSSLKEYFDPKSGRFQERIERLVSKDGELEQLLRRQIGNEDSELCKTLSSHIGEDSPLLKQLSPDQSDGILAALRATLEKQLGEQREQVLGQFSLDNKEGALTRFINELTDHQGKVSGELQDKIDDVVKQFSLDDEDSALSRLVRNMERAQKTIISEFSLDEENSALARLKRELLTLFKEDRETNQQFQEEVKGALQAMQARRKEADRSTRHGLEFEDALFEFVQHESQKVGDVATHTGNSTGDIKNCKVGDTVVELGPDSAAPDARLVIEAKEMAGYNLQKARDEIETARNNRHAQVGLFVFSKKIAPEGLEPLARYGQDVVVVWDSEDPATDLFLRVGLTLTRALCVRTRAAQAEQSADFSEIDRAILEIEKRTGALDDIETWVTTIQNNSEKILKKLKTTRKSLETQTELLREKTDGLKDILAGSEAD